MSPEEKGRRKTEKNDLKKKKLRSRGLSRLVREEGFSGRRPDEEKWGQGHKSKKTTGFRRRLHIKSKKALALRSAKESAKRLK